MPDLYLAVGSLNREAPYFQGARGEGLTIFAFDKNSGAAARICSETSIDNPTFFSVAPSGVVYASSEVFGWHEGTISAYRFDPETGALIYLNKQPCQGSITAHNTVTEDGRFVLIANYAMGQGGPDQSLVAVPINPDGSLAPIAGSVRHQGRLGPDAERQERPHAHSIMQVPQSGLFLSADLGLDQVIAYRLLPQGDFQPTGAVDMAPGAGPRHIAPHPGGRFAYVSNELDSTVSLIGIAGDQLQLIQTLPTVPDGVESHGADIHISPDGRFLYCSNRGHDSIAIFQIDPADGQMTPAGWVPSGGATPRNFALSPNGNWLLVANQNGDHIRVFARNAETGALTNTVQDIDIGTPVCLRFFTR